ncbi:MAG: sugar translocase, partial [Clostridia bacterium]|nr:sugar translocase [Clostridia bacterium]
MEESMSRTENSTKNVISGLICQIVVILVGFAVRTVFIRTLGEEFLGINGLFSNFISMLSLAELGIGTSITYKLYKPLADKDVDSICKYMNLYRILYRIIGIVMLALGLLMMPIIPHMIKGDTSFFNVYVVFAIYLLQSVSTYLLFAYKSALVKADQKAYVVTNVTMFVYIAEYILQIIVLILFKNFYAYIGIVVVGNVVINLIVSLFVDRRYEYLEKNKKILPEKADVKEMFKDCYALSLYKVNGVVLKSVD